jgi:hypothetical protein
MIQPPTPPGASLFPPQIFYWGYPNGPISPTYFGPLQIPPHAFTPHFTHDRPPTLVSYKYKILQISYTQKHSFPFVFLFLHNSFTT